MPGFDPSWLRLIAITDSLRDGVDGLVARALAAVQGGSTMIQLRLKDEPPRTLVTVARALRHAVPAVPLIINERADVALAADAHGVHIGVDDIAPAALRRILPPSFIIGVSVGDERDVARVLAGMVDYVGIGPVFGSGGRGDADLSIGTDRFRELARRCGVPAVAIGGITTENAAAVILAGASGIAVINAIFRADDPTRRAHALRSVLDASES